MEKIIKMIDGNKTYITLALAGVIFSLNFWGAIDERMFQYLLFMDSLLIGGSVRDAMKKIK